MYVFVTSMKGCILDSVLLDKLILLQDTRQPAPIKAAAQGLKSAEMLSPGRSRQILQSPTAMKKTASKAASRPVVKPNSPRIML